MIKASDSIKAKGMEKVKQMSSGGLFGGGSSDVKVEQWLNGFLKIPFGIYKKNKVISFMNHFPKKVYTLLDSLQNKFDKEYGTLFDQLRVHATDSNINRIILELGKMIMNGTFSQFYSKKISSIINEWNVYKLDRRMYIKDVRKILDDAVYGNDEAKNQIEKIIGQWINGKMEGAVLGLQGPPGVGKTTIAKKGLCKCLKDDNDNARPFAFLPLGGSANGSSLVGHSYTYIGSVWGRLVDILMEAKCMNPIIFIDEIDKVSRTEHGREIIGILTHLTDATQNDEFNDKYFAGIKFDFSKVLFVFSYNEARLIDPILRDRITEINVKPLTTKDKITVVSKYMLPDIVDGVGMDKNDIKIDDSVLAYLIESYTYEAGVRKLKEKMQDIVRDLNLQKIYGETEETQFKLTKELIDKILSKKPKITFKKIPKKPTIGYVNGLYATTAGIGGLTVIEVVKTYSDTKFGMTLTGSQGDVMKESMTCAKTIAWNVLPLNIKKKIQEDWKENGSWGLHIHTPDAATPKDGPSAGGAITLGILSRLTNVPVRNNVAMTGEIDLNGSIKKIGGLVAKLTGAFRAGATTVFIPKENKDDLDKMIEEKLYPEGKFRVVCVEHISEIIQMGLIDNDLEFNF